MIGVVIKKMFITIVQEGIPLGRTSSMVQVVNSQEGGWTLRGTINKGCKLEKMSPKSNRVRNDVSCKTFRKKKKNYKGIPQGGGKGLAYSKFKQL